MEQTRKSPLRLGIQYFAESRPTLGTFGGFDFDSDVFSDFMSEQSYIKNAILASGILREDATIASLIGEKGNTGTMPFYVPIDANADDYKPLNNDGKTNNTPADLKGGKQTFMAIQRMKAFKDQDFTRELTGANPLQNIGTQLASYYQQVWQSDLLAVIRGVLANDKMASHKTNLSVTTGTVAESNLIQEASVIELAQKACGDMANRFTIVMMHSAVYAHLQKLMLIEFNKYTIGNAIMSSVELPTYNGRIVVVDDRGTVDTTVSGFPVYSTYLVGEGAILTAQKSLINPYYAAYDPETNAGVNKLYTKQSRILHPNGFSFAADEVVGESPSTAELETKENWTLKFNDKNVLIAEIKTNG